MRIVVGPPGVLVAIEGIDGAGKSTQAQRVGDALEAEGYGVVRTHEPTDGPWGRRIRASATAGRLSPEAEVEAFLEDRKEHVATLLRPALDAGKVVLVDRYYFSSVAYQGARGIDPLEILRRNEAIAPPPDLLVLLDLEAPAGVARVHHRGASNLFEREDDLRRARDIFLRTVPPTCLRVDATQGAEAVTAVILAALRERVLAGRALTKAS